MQLCLSRRGQAALSEYMIILFIVIGSVTAISTFVRRALQARIHDTRNYMISVVNNANVCDANCQAATGNVGYEYEPYYTQMGANTVQNSVVADVATNGTIKGEGVYTHLMNEVTATSYQQTQLPVECLGVTPPSCCKNNPPNC